MKYFLLPILFVFVAPLAMGQSANDGVITHRISSCDYFLVQTATGYDLLEWYGGHDPGKGDEVVGKFESYGFHSVVDATADEDMRVYTEDYQLSKDSALEMLADKCE